MDWFGIIGALTIAIIAIIKQIQSDADKTEKIGKLASQNKAQEDRILALEKSCADCHSQREEDQKQIAALKGERAAEKRIADQMQNVLDARKDSDRRFWALLFSEHGQKMKMLFDRELGRLVKGTLVKDDEEKMGDTLEA